MKLLHLADLHIGKRLNEISLLAEQRHVLEQILEVAQRERPQAVLLAGDIYDKPTPAAEAVQLCDWFLTQLAQIVPALLLVPGNHDSAERLAFAASLLEKQGVYIAPPFNGELARVELADEFGPVDFYLLPFIKPALVRRCWPQEEAPADYNSAVGRVISRLVIRPGVRSVLLAHQLITGAATCASEELAIGGMDNVDVSWFDAFTYVALGHLHSPQQVSRPQVRYCGSPLKYSFSEARQQKSLTIVEIGPPEAPAQIRTLPLPPLHDLREIKGPFAQLTGPTAQASQDYLHITLTDEEDVLEALLQLRRLYPNLLKLDYDNSRTRASRRLELTAEQAANMAARQPFELFADFYQQQNNRRLTEEQATLLRQLIEEIWEAQK